MAPINTRLEFVGSGNIQAGADTIHLRDTYITDSLKVSEVGQAELDGRFVTDSVLGALNELIDGLTTTSGAIGVDGSAELTFTTASGVEFVIQHDLDSEIWSWGMWNTDTDPIEFIQPENIYASGLNFVAVTLDQPADGRIVLSVGGPHGGDTAGLHVDEREATGDIVPDTHATHDLGSDSKRWDNVYGISGIFGAASVRIGDDLTIDGKPVQPVLHTDTTFFIATTGDDSTGDGSNSTPWKTLFKAFDHLNGFDIATGVTITIDVEDGTYTAVPEVNISHPKARQIVIIGDTSTPVGNLITAASAGSKTFTIAGDQTADYPAGSLCHVMGAGLNDSTYTVVSAVFGASTVVTVDQTPQDSSTQGTLYNCPASFNCIFEMAAGENILIESVVLSKIDGICIKADTGAGGENGIALNHGAGIITVGPNVCTIGCATGYSVAHESFIAEGFTLVAHDCSRGIVLSFSSSAVLKDGASMCNNDVQGFLCADGSFMSVSNTGAGDSIKRAVGCQNGGDGIVARQGSFVFTQFAMAIGNGGIGIVAAVHAGIEATSSTARFNVSGFFAIAGAVLNCPSSTGSDNDQQGFWADGFATLRALSCLAQNNAGGVLGTNAGHVSFNAGTSNTNSVSDFSPALNTIGNNNSTIQG